MSVAFLTHPSLGVRHGFFTRRGGVSAGGYASLNCSVSGGDDPDLVAENRARVAAAMGVAPARLVGVTQVHGVAVAKVDAPWAAGASPPADAMVTAVPGLALGVITADCAPVLFAGRGVVGAAHAGWRGAAGGVLEATMAAMEAAGVTAGPIKAVVGPCIGQASYEVGEEMRAQVDGGDAFFAPGHRAGHWQFDLAGYCVARLRAAGVEAARVEADTFADEARFFSHRRRVLAGGGVIGHQISCVVA